MIKEKKMKTRLIYSPHSPGCGIADGMLSYVAQHLEEFTGPEGTLEFSNAVFIDALRLEIIKETIKPEDIEIVTLNGIVNIDETGKLSLWPEGVDSHENIVREIVRLRSAKRKQVGASS